MAPHRPGFTRHTSNRYHFELGFHLIRRNAVDSWGMPGQVSILTVALAQYLYRCKVAISAFYPTEHWLSSDYA
jgi:hypothetical protein